jgi:hypothetical protein
MAVQILRHAFSMIFGNLGQALRVSVGPYLLLIFAAVACFAVIGFPAMSQLDATSAAFDPEVLQGISILALPIGIFLIVLGLFVFGWVAVSWHRFILLEEYAGKLPQVSGRPIWPYVGRSILYGFLIILIAMPLFSIFGLLAAPFASNPNSPLVIAILVIPSAILTFIWFRISLVLPSIAVGKPITMGQAWAASSGLASTILGVAFLLMLFNGIGGFVLGLVSKAAPIIGFVFDLGFQWLMLMVGISILTTFYGHLIEKRPLVD